MLPCFNQFQLIIDDNNIRNDQIFIYRFSYHFIAIKGVYHMIRALRYRIILLQSEYCYVCVYQINQAYMSIKILKWFACLLSVVHLTTIVHLPLDQRFTTRVAFLNLATLTPFNIVSLPESLLPNLKQYHNPSNITYWFTSEAMFEQYSIISLEMFLYGGLIASRISKEAQDVIMARIELLQTLKRYNPNLKIYASAVIMRIPAYDGDFEQPAYYAQYGRLLYLYSYFSDKYNKTGQLSDYDKMNLYKRQIPTDVLNEFLDRRKRNQNVLIQLIRRYAGSIKQGNRLFEKLYITLDDNAQYGFNVAEADEIKKLVNDYQLKQQVLIYPGADEVPLVLLAKFTADYYQNTPKIAVIYRNQTSKKYIPNFEGEPLENSVKNQIKAAGGTLAQSSNQITLLINNFDGPLQNQAANQKDDQLTPYTLFDKYISSNTTLGFVDNKYSNGADIAFVTYLLQKTKQAKRSIAQWAYAGWNTNGNTLGTVVANAVLLSILNKRKANNYMQSQIVKEKSCNFCSPCNKGDYLCGNSYFNLLRILEDRDWQAILRQKMLSYLEQVPTQNFNSLNADSQFYQRFALKSFRAKSEEIQKYLGGASFTINSVYFPWNRTFQVGISGNLSQKCFK